jgi:hypothetical protein
MKYFGFTLLIAVIIAAACNTNLSRRDKSHDKLYKALTNGNDSLRFESYYELIDSLKAGAYNGTDLGDYKDTIVADAARVLLAAEKYYREVKDIKRLRQNPDYLVVQSNLGLLLDILGYISKKEVIPILRRSLDLSDPTLDLFAASSLIKMEQHVPDEVMEVVAADETNRLWLFQLLHEMHRDELFPKKYCSQELLARSEMVQWLEYPTELGQEPDEIVLEKTVRKVVNGEEQDFYLFRFRCSDTTWRDNGWMAGIAGGYKVIDEPTPYDQGSTFSGFEKWDSKTPEEHLNSTLGLLDEAWKDQTQKKDSVSLSKTPQ